MRILWIKAGGLVPLDTGGKIRSFYTIRELARQHEITLYTFYEAHSPDVHHELEGVVGRLVARPLQLPRRHSISDTLLAARLLVSGMSYTMGKYYQPEVRREVDALCGQRDYDVIVCDFICPAGLLRWPGLSPTVLFTHNVEAEIWERQHRLTHNPVLKLALQLEARALARAERKYAELADHVISVSDRNADHFRAFAGEASVSVVPTGVDVDYFYPDQAASTHSDLVFTGSMDWMPNEDSVRYFVKEILPLIWEAIPETRFWAVGRNPSPALWRLADGERVFVTGTVDDIRPYLSRAQIFVVPIRSGSGTRLKIFEAMAAGKAVVSTSIGAEGLAVTHGENIVVEDDSADFAAAVISLLKNGSVRETLGTAARRFVEERHSWSATTVAFEEILRRTVEAANSKENC